MSNRWCIIAGARSGSTWLEEMIYNAFPTGHYQMKLGEPLEYSEDYFKSSRHNHQVVLNDHNCVELRRLTEFTSVNKLEHYNNVFETLSNADPTQSVVMKVFCQDWKYSVEQYIKFLTMLRDCGYKFINLKRPIIDRATSWWFMEHSKIVHKWKSTNRGTFYSSNTDFKNDHDHEELTKVDLKTWTDYVNLSWTEDQLNQKICEMFDVITINYNTLIEDCNRFNININSNTIVQKLYDIDYKHKMSNYMDLITLTNSKEFVNKFGEENRIVSSIDQTICRFAWDYPVLQISRNELRNCCRSKSNRLSDTDLDTGKDIFKNFIPVNNVKKDLLMGIKNDACKSCWTIESKGGKSPRLGFDNFVNFSKKNIWSDLTNSQIKEKLTKLSENEINDLVNIDDVRMIEISLGNTCDLKCVYCHHHYSSQWAAEQLKYGEIKIHDVEKELPKIKDTKFESAWWDWFETSAAYKLTCINFIGGEPLIMDKFYTYVDRILDFYKVTEVNQSIINISVVTNFNTPEKQFNKFLKLVDKIIESDKFKLDLNISMESLGSRAEFIRTGTDWNHMMSNIKRFLDFLNQKEISLANRIIFNVQLALNSLCISDLPNFLKFIIDLQKTSVRPINLRQNQVVYPQWSSPTILPESFTSYIDQSIEILSTEKVDHSKYTLFGRWDSYITFLHSVKAGINYSNKNQIARKEFAENITKLSERRRLDFPGTFPEMIDFYEECKKL